MNLKENKVHSFHIPVMGTAFTIDAPLKVGRYGISSVVSIGDDELCETMRKHYSDQYKIPFEPIEKKHNEIDYRVNRIRSYLNLINQILSQQFEELKQTAFEEGSEISKYFEMLPATHDLKVDYLKMLSLAEGDEKNRVQDELRQRMRVGMIDVNIMTKIDMDRLDSERNTIPFGSDALTALRAYAESDLDSSIIFSAGFNRRLYAYCEEFKGFFPDENGMIKKRIVLKVSDFRSSVIQGKFLAKKGLWVSEYRIESGLNCGGHAFATDGYLIGPILSEFNDKLDGLCTDLREICQGALSKNGAYPLKRDISSLLTVQGGIGTSEENIFLHQTYKVDGTGWATPFLLVPEVTVLDDKTRQLLLNAGTEDTYLSDISPLGVPFNTVRGTESEKNRLKRAYEDEKPGSPCPKGHLVSSTKYSKQPVCLASRFYQKREIEALDKENLEEEMYEKKYARIISKTCLCEDLAAAALIVTDIHNKRPLKTTVCPGPNIAHFARLATLKEMAGHIYGRLNLIPHLESRPHMFMTELKMYIAYIENEISKVLPKPDQKQIKYLNQFKNNLLDGISYYRELIPKILDDAMQVKERMKQDLAILKLELDDIIAKHQDIFQPLPNNSSTAAA